MNTAVSPKPKTTTPRPAATSPVSSPDRQESSGLGKTPIEFYLLMGVMLAALLYFLVMPFFMS